MSVRQRAADLLYAMCDRSNAKQIVSEMLRYLETADYAIREEIVSPGGAGPLDPREEGPGVPDTWGLQRVSGEPGSGYYALGPWGAQARACSHARPCPPAGRS